MDGWETLSPFEALSHIWQADRGVVIYSLVGFRKLNIKSGRDPIPNQNPTQIIRVQYRAISVGTKLALLCLPFLSKKFAKMSKERKKERAKENQLASKGKRQKK